MAVALSHQGSFGFALQAAQGVFATPDNWVPLIERGGPGPAENLAARKNYHALDWADVRAYQTAYFSTGEWVEGQVRFPLVPGTLTDLFSWIQDRDGENQGKWASAVVDCVHEVKQITDLKVRRASFELVTGEPVICTLELTGLAIASGSTPTPVMPAEPPYLYREALVELAIGGVPAAEGNCERMRLTIDTCLQAAEEGLRLAPSGAPAQLYNLAGLRARGAFSRDFADSGVYQDFLGGTEAALAVALQRGAAVAEIELPRILYVADGLGLPGSHERRLVEEVEFLALGSEDGATPPVVLG